jgi:mannose-6-phosphate isomerase-like protein (cupin superfamily)
MSLLKSPAPLPLPAHGVRVWESHHDHGFQMAPERRPFLEMFYILDGAGHCVLDGRRHPCQAGDVVVALPGVYQHFEDALPVTSFGIEIAVELIPQEPRAAEPSPALRGACSSASTTALEVP